MKVDVDTQFRIRAAAMFALEFYKIMMGTLLTIFVPHRCQPDRSDEVCSVGEVLAQIRDSDEGWRRSAAALNVCSALAVIVLYGFELYRENWMIEYLDVDASKPNDNLDAEIEAYPAFKATMHRLNRLYLRASKAVAALVVGNFAVSGVYLFFSSFFAGVQTLTALVSYLILVLMKLVTTEINAKASVRKDRAYSAYLLVHKTYNTIDADHRRPGDGEAACEEPRPAAVVASA
jgi:hypothetical protein